jgi:Sulfotransferase family
MRKSKSRTHALGRQPAALAGATPPAGLGGLDPGVSDGTRAGRAADRPPGGPIIVLSYPHAGAEALSQLLSASRSLACTSGTGIIPLCHAAMATWQQAEEPGHRSSALAVKSVRVLVDQMITIIKARNGASRWCETVFTNTAAAATFGQVFPAATFACLHRSLPAVLAEGILAYPWGLGASPFWPFSGPHPGNNAATITAYWAARTQDLLNFEASHSAACVRIRHEDLVAGTGAVAAEICTHLGLNSNLTHGNPDAGHQGSKDEPDQQLAIPEDQIPPALLATVTELHEELDYPIIQSHGPAAGGPGDAP